MSFRPSVFSRSKFFSSRYFRLFETRRLPLMGLVAGFGFSLAMQGVALAAPLDPTGLWYTTGEDSIIKITPCLANNTTFCGTLVWLREPLEDGKPKVDHENPDKAKRTQPMIGIQLLSDLAAEKDLWRGKAYNPEDGRTYNITFKVLPAKGHEKDKTPGDSAEIEGCILRILCKTDGFTRAHSIPGQADATTSAPASPHPVPSATAPKPSATAPATAPKPAKPPAH
ncbi:DUF2147 domain-containing protein [Beijerinckia indica]|uniref:DUF2147 domain-containing protein n=1 Tax=Beijerinckia indica subsp. indica (strain ATCC 9039 / DSM 1715 / NCIMB 8712) TaxID=395963 RepID=B2IEA0_BEII9|nr:DUF2147 domain-containing protein [Beijerinckia indica]ACB95498.1 hypothetical protein Bind_1874 [Beijerinckia indica subsp. indica ATCC 9039]